MRNSCARHEDSIWEIGYLPFDTDAVKSICRDANCGITMMDPF